MVKKQVQAFLTPYLKPLLGLGIRKKIAYGYILAIGIALFGAISARIVHITSEKAEEKAEEIAESAKLLKELEGILLEVHHLPHRLALLTNNPQEFNQKATRLFNCINALELLLNHIQPCSDSTDKACGYGRLTTNVQLQKWLKDHRGTISIYSEQIETLLQDVDPVAWETTKAEALGQSLVHFSSSEVSRTFGLLSDELLPIFPVFDAAFNEAHTAYEDAEALEGNILLLSLLVSALIATVFAIVTSRAIAHPLEITTQIAQQVTKTSDFNLRAPVITQDEVGQLTLALNHLIQRVSEYTQALQTAKESAEAASRAKSEFLSKMSHEFRTPLNAILGFTQVMGNDPSLNPEQQEHLDTISRSGEHLLVLINDVLEMAKIEAGQITLNESNFDLHRLLKSLQEMLQIRAQAKGLRLIFDCPSDIPQYLRTDEGKLRQVLINLLGNAIKFTRRGWVKLRIRAGDESLLIGNRQEASPYTLPLTPYSLRFEVEDTGPGIAPEEIETLFSAFVQTSTGQQSQEGTGLGLAISRQFVNLMGGNITVDSALGEGATFRFGVQVGLVQTVDMELPHTNRTVIKLAPDQPDYRILVVEDNPVNRRVMVKLLTLCGFQVREAINGEEAVALMESYPPDLIWMDMQMPVMDGYEATRRIKAGKKESGYAGEAEEGERESSQELGESGHLSVVSYQAIAEGKSQIPSGAKRSLSGAMPDKAVAPRAINPKSKIQPPVIIALTASAFEEDRNKILAAGCDDIVNKPFRKEVIFEKMAQYLGVRYLYAGKPENEGVHLSRNFLAGQDFRSGVRNQEPVIEWILDSDS